MDASHPSPPKRQHPRSRVLVVVRWHNRQEESVPAELCDVSAEGVFLVPTGPLPDNVSSGDPVWISVHTTAGDEVLSGTIRWRGFHPSHEATGCGIQLDPRSLGIVERIFPILRKPANS